MINFLCQEQANPTTTIIVYGVLFAILIAMLIIPMVRGRKENQEYELMLTNLKVGDLVETKGGVIGKVLKLVDKGEIKTMIIETGSKTEKSYMEMDIVSVGRVLKSSKAPKEETKEVEENLEGENTEEPAKTEEKPAEKKVETKTKNTTKKTTSSKKTTKK